MATSPCSLQIRRFLSSSSLPNGGKVDREILRQEGQSSHASTPLRLRQFRALAISSANNFFPMPASPVKSRELESRLTASARPKVFLTSSLPIRVENIGAR